MAVRADFLLDAFEQLFARNGAGGDGDVVLPASKALSKRSVSFALMREQFGKLDAQIGDDGLNRIQSLYNGFALGASLRAHGWLKTVPMRLGSAR